ncbi:MAG: hypothetical protein KatS3mg087_1396 [Patescibacteria group bacterium]|nr:MAG: hypothetical protein KatS3mg087_1396 [Patescibacteria group bacterium]
MLVIAAKNNEKIIVEHEGEVLVIQVRQFGNRTKIGFEGPNSFTILRESIIDKIVNPEGKVDGFKKD